MRNISTILILALLALPASVSAQANRPSTLRIMDRIARNHFEAGNEYFQVARYDDAAREFQRAFDISHQNELLFNIARALESAGDVSGALSAYERFDQAGAPGFDRDVLHQRMENLRSRIAASASPAPANGQSQGATGGPTSSGQPTTGSNASPSPSASSSPSSAVHPRTRVEYHRGVVAGIGPFVLLGVGAVTGVLAGLFAFIWSSEASTLSQANSGQMAWSPDGQTAYNNLPTNGSLAWVFGGVGAVCLIGGVVALITRGPGERTEVPIAFVAPTPGGAIVGVGGSL